MKPPPRKIVNGYETLLRQILESTITILPQKQWHIIIALCLYAHTAVTEWVIIQFWEKLLLFIAIYAIRNIVTCVARGKIIFSQWDANRYIAYADGKKIPSCSKQLFNTMNSSKRGLARFCETWRSSFRNVVHQNVMDECETIGWHVQTADITLCKWQSKKTTK